MQITTVAQPSLKLNYACDGLTVRLYACPDTPDHYKLELFTPDARYEYGDYPSDEAHERARHLIESRKAWSPASHGACWRPEIWQVRDYHRGGKEFWRRGPRGSELCVHQPHGTYWRTYWDSSPVVRSHEDKGVYGTPWEAMGALDELAANGMKDVLLD